MNPIKPKRLTASALKRHVEQTEHSRFFFTRNNMKFSGDRMDNYYVGTNPVTVTSVTGTEHTCWELSRIRPVKHGLRDSAYFDVHTFEQVHVKK